jgi:hypothetical protein
MGVNSGCVTPASESGLTQTDPDRLTPHVVEAAGPAMPARSYESFQAVWKPPWNVLARQSTSGVP